VSDEQEKPPGRMLRPKVRVLGEEALLPETSVISPAPNRFSHELSEREDPFPAGTRVLLLVEGPKRSWVADGAGTYAEVKSASLRELKS
jgi:hypothetical protein